MRALFALFIRSLREDTRGRVAPFLRTGLVAIILFMVWVIQQSFAYQSAPGREFFNMVVALNLSFIVLASLSIFPGAIADEKEDDTLTLLRMTNLSSLSILFGKSTTRLIEALLLLAVQLPFTLLAITLGGVGSDQIWAAYAMLGATVFFLCNLSLVASVYCRTTMRASIFTAVLLVVLFTILPFIAVVTTGMLKTGLFGFTPVGAWEQVAKLSIEGHPIYALMSIIEPRFSGRRTSLFPTDYVIIHVVGGIACFLLSWMMFNRYCSAPEEIRRSSGRRWAGVSRTWCRFPIAWKEFFFTLGGRTGFLVRFGMCAAIFATIYILRTIDDYPGYRSYVEQLHRFWRDVSGAVMIISGMCAGLELVLITGRLFGPERRRLTLAGLVSLPWSVGKIVRQKVAGILAIFVPWIILALTAFLIMPEYWIKEIGEEIREVTWRYDREEISALVYFTLQSLLLLVTMVWFSLRIRRGALPAAMGVLAVWNILFAIVMSEMDSSYNRDMWLGFLIGAMVTLPVTLMMSYAVGRRIEIAAAEE